MGIPKSPSPHSIVNYNPRFIAPLLLLSLTGVPAASAQEFSQVATVPEPTSLPSIPVVRLARDILLDGDDLFLSAPETTTSGNREGVIAHYSRNGSSWAYESLLEIPFQNGEQELGWSMAKSGDRFLAAARGFNVGQVAYAGAVFEFNRIAGVWTLDPNRIEPPVPFTWDEFGRSLAMSGSWAAVSAFRDDTMATDAGAVHVYQRTIAGWVFTQTLRPAVPTLRGFYGTSLVMRGDKLIVGSPGAGDGLVDVYERSGQSWNRIQTLYSSTLNTDESFGYSIDFDGSTLVVGAPDHGPSTTSIGALEVFQLFGNTFVYSTRFEGPASHAQALGTSVQVDGDLIAAGSPRDWWGGLGGGAVYTYHQTSTGNWSAGQVLVPAETKVGSSTGFVVRIQGSEIATSGYVHTQPNGHVGVCWLFSTAVSGVSPFGIGNGTPAPCPCGNNSTLGRTQGCAQFSGIGGELIANGSTLAAADDLTLTAHNLPPFNFGILFNGTTVNPMGAWIGDGLLFAGGPLTRFSVQASDGLGRATWGPGLIAAHPWLTGQTYHYQVWFRDHNGPCGSGYNTTNGLSVTFQ